MADGPFILKMVTWKNAGEKMKHDVLKARQGGAGYFGGYLMLYTI